MSSLAPPAARGWEYLTGTGWDWDDELARLPEWLAEKAVAPSVEPGRVRPGDRPVQPVADHPRVGGTRHRVRPGHRVRGRVRGHQLRHAGPARHPALRLAAHARHRGPHGPARPGDGRLRRRRGRDRRVGPGARRDPGRLPARPHVRPTPRPRPQQRLRLRRLPAPGAAAADGERVAAAGPGGRPRDGRPDRRRGRRDLRRGRPVVVDRHAAGELPVHRPAVLPHPRRAARRAAARRGLPGAHHRLLGLARRARRPVDVAAVRRDELRQGAAGAERGGRPRLPVGAVPPRQCAQHPCGGVCRCDRRRSSSGRWPGRSGPGVPFSSRRRARPCCAGPTPR